MFGKPHGCSTGSIKPAAIFSTGGYVAGPVLLAALWKRLPVIVMEPNAVPGFTHRRLARFVARALISFPETARWFPKGRTELTGRPVDDELFAIPPKPPGKIFTILITGGSQGSRTLNRAVEETWPLWKDRSIRLLHQSGAAGYEDLAAGFPKSGLNGTIAPFFDDMLQKFAEADLVVSRSGRSSQLSELAAARQAIDSLVPFPTAADQHQLRNAEAFQDAGAGRLILDADLTGARLVEEVTRIRADPAVLESMGRAARTLARPGAADTSGGHPGRVSPETFDNTVTAGKPKQWQYWKCSLSPNTFTSSASAESACPGWPKCCLSWGIA